MSQTTLTPAAGPCRLGGAGVRPADGLYRLLLYVQGFYYGVTGVWPLVHVESFQWVTGPKYDHYSKYDQQSAAVPTQADHWLLMTVGALITVVALVLLVAAWRRQAAGEVALLAVASAVALTAIDVIYVYRETIARIYLLDAAAEVVLLAGWAVALFRRYRAGASPGA